MTTLHSWFTGSKERVQFHWLDLLVLTAVGCTITFVVYRVSSSLHYRWDWRVVPTYFVYFDQRTDSWRSNILLQGLLTTIRIVLWAAVFAFIIGLVAGLSRVSTNLFLRLTSRIYVDVIRGIPPLVIIFVFYFFVSSQIMPLLGIASFLRDASASTRQIAEFFLGPPSQVSAFLSAMICLALFEGAYVAEIVRAGIQSVEKGQWEAATSLGLKGWATMRHVVLPQAFQRMMPPLAGQFISLIKDSSIASLISVQELAFMAAQASSSTSRIFEVWIAVAAMYFVLCFSLAWLFGKIESQMRPPEQGSRGHT